MLGPQPPKAWAFCRPGAQAGTFGKLGLTTAQGHLGVHRCQIHPLPLLAFPRQPARPGRNSLAHPWQLVGVGGAKTGGPSEPPPPGPELQGRHLSPDPLATWLPHLDGNKGDRSLQKGMVTEPGCIGGALLSSHSLRINRLTSLM